MQVLALALRGFFCQIRVGHTNIHCGLCLLASTLIRLRLIGRRRSYSPVPDDIGNYGSPAGFVEYHRAKPAIDPDVQVLLGFLLRKAERWRHRQEKKYYDP